MLAFLHLSVLGEPLGSLRLSALVFLRTAVDSLGFDEALGSSMDPGGLDTDFWSSVAQGGLSQILLEFVFGTLRPSLI